MHITEYIHLCIYIYHLPSTNLNPAFITIKDHKENITNNSNIIILIVIVEIIVMIRCRKMPAFFTC